MHSDRGCKTADTGKGEGEEGVSGQLLAPRREDFRGWTVLRGDVRVQERDGSPMCCRVKGHSLLFIKTIDFSNVRQKRVMNQKVKGHRDKLQKCLN